MNIVDLVKVLFDVIKLIATAILVILENALKLLPIYEQLSGLKEEFIAVAIGVPVSVITIICSIPLIIKVIKKIREQFP